MSSKNNNKLNIPEARAAMEVQDGGCQRGGRVSTLKNFCKPRFLA